MKTLESERRRTGMKIPKGSPPSSSGKISRSGVVGRKGIAPRLWVRVAVCVLPLTGVLIAALIPGPKGWSAEGDSVVNTPHNLSASGPGPVKAPSETEICIFCHTGHRAGVTPLWNRSLSKASYITYKSSTAKASPGQPTGASKLCLSCHDGTIAVGRLLSRPKPLLMGSGKSPRGRKNLGTDLSDDHPISMNYNQAMAAKGRRYKASPMVSDHSLLDENDQVQCTSCHDPHNNQHGRFLVMDNREGRLCQICHTLSEWMQSSHNTSTARWNGSERDPWPNTEYEDVRGNGCANCHSIHNAGGAEQLLTFESQAEVCYSCHNGAVALKDVRPDFEKPYRHRVEDVVGGRSKTLGQGFDTSRVGCTDCHNPHGTNDMGSMKPQVSGALMHVAGVSAGGGIVERAQFEYEICYKCHSRQTQKDLTRQVRRARFQSSLREKFSASAVSFHPVEAVGRNPDVPSLIPPLTESSLITCTDCHNSDSFRGEGGLTVNGPHGSRYRYLLERRYETTDMVSESEAAYSLCYKCHDRLNILGDRSFSEHNSHVVLQRASCSICHDPHGVGRSQGTVINNAHMINFDVTVVRPDTQTGRLEYISEGFRTGSCYLNCHGVDHSPGSY